MTGRRSGVFVNTTATAVYTDSVRDWDGGLGNCTELLRIDAGTGRQGRARGRFDGTVRLDGYGIAVATNATDTELE